MANVLQVRRNKFRSMLAAAHIQSALIIATSRFIANYGKLNAPRHLSYVCNACNTVRGAAFVIGHVSRTAPAAL
jgi:hypothetical protein